MVRRCRGQHTAGKRQYLDAGDELVAGEVAQRAAPVARQVVDVPAVLAVGRLLRAVIDLLGLLAAVAGAVLCVPIPPGTCCRPLQFINPMETCIISSCANILSCSM